MIKNKTSLCDYSFTHTLKMLIPEFAIFQYLIFGIGSNLLNLYLHDEFVEFAQPGRGEFLDQLLAGLFVRARFKFGNQSELVVVEVEDVILLGVDDASSVFFPLTEVDLQLHGDVADHQGELPLSLGTLKGCRVAESEVDLGSVDLSDAEELFAQVVKNDAVESAVEGYGLVEPEDFSVSQGVVRAGERFWEVQRLVYRYVVLLQKIF